jgi:hypothetical protein
LDARCNHLNRAKCRDQKSFRFFAFAVAPKPMTPHCSLLYTSWGGTQFDAKCRSCRAQSQRRSQRMLWRGGCPDMTVYCYSRNVIRSIILLFLNGSFLQRNATKGHLQNDPSGMLALDNSPASPKERGLAKLRFVTQSHAPSMKYSNLGSTKWLCTGSRVGAWGVVRDVS